MNIQPISYICDNLFYAKQYLFDFKKINQEEYDIITNITEQLIQSNSITSNLETIRESDNEYILHLYGFIENLYNTDCSEDISLYEIEMLLNKCILIVDEYLVYNKEKEHYTDFLLFLMTTLSQKDRVYLISFIDNITMYFYHKWAYYVNFKNKSTIDGNLKKVFDLFLIFLNKSFDKLYYNFDIVSVSNMETLTQMIDMLFLIDKVLNNQLKIIKITAGEIITTAKNENIIGTVDALFADSMYYFLTKIETNNE